MSTRSRPGAAATLTLAALALCGCGDLSTDEVAAVGTDFATAASDPAARCELLAPNTLTALVEQESSACEEAIGTLPLGSGEVTAVEVWGQEAQVRLTDDTLFLTRTSAGWRVSAAACEPQGEDLPYDCQLEAS
jgi:hypothetical protein